MLLAGDVQRYFKQLVEEYQRQLYAFAYRLTGSQPDAEDIVQEAFVRAYVALATYPATRIQTLKLRPWLYSITLHEFHHHTRGARLHMVPIDFADDSPAFTLEDSADERPEVLVESQEQLQELEIMVARLPERYRVAITCYYFEHLNYQEIAELLEQPLGTVKSTVSRGVRLLRTMLLPQQFPGREGNAWNPRIVRDRKA
ncbi:MAG TPA: RNA polymerase sigma factor [Ktedonosporobacter sp.]|nr:RNA polymerase sigma factor [Ktedonosporobacter sp.]